MGFRDLIRKLNSDRWTAGSTTCHGHPRRRHNPPPLLRRVEYKKRRLILNNHELKYSDYSFFKKYELLSSTFMSIRPSSNSGDHVMTDITALKYEPINTWNVTSKQTWDIDLMLDQCCATVHVAGPALVQHWVDVSCSLGYNLRHTDDFRLLANGRNNNIDK